MRKSGCGIAGHDVGRELDVHVAAKAIGQGPEDRLHQGDELRLGQQVVKGQDQVAG